MKASEVQESLRELADPQRAESHQRFFKTKKGQYGAGDQFIGVKVPEMRALVKNFRGIALKEILQVLKSPVHEDRQMALFLLVDAYEKAKKRPEEQEKVVAAYLKNLKYVNNWDLVDSSAPKILGDWLRTRDRSILDEQVRSTTLWTRRVAMVATQTLIRHGESQDALRLAEVLLDDQADLMHKASGWMLREVGEKVGLVELRGFLKKHAARMPRTMLRYAIEKLPPAERQKWMAQG